MNACEASGLCTRSVVYLYTLCVYRYGAVSRRPGKCREAAKILLRQQQGYSPQAAEKHAQRAAPTVACLPCKGKLPKGRRVYSFCFCKKNQKAAARTCKKLPVASFCASETAETGRIANGCEQGDHVSRRKGAKARAACCPNRGELPACQEVPERETDCYFLRRAKSNTKSTRGKPCDPGSNRRSIRCFG